MKKKAVKSEALLIISLSLLAVTGYSQQKPDTGTLRRELDSVLVKYGLKSKGFAINVISINQAGGQTAYSITNTYYNGPKHREMTDSLLIAIVSKMPNLQAHVIIERRSQDPESLQFAEKIKQGLLSYGCPNVRLSGIVTDQTFGIGEDESVKEQLKLKIEWNGSHLHIVIPSNQ